MSELNYLKKDRKIADENNFVTYVDFQVANGKADMWLYDIFPGIQLMISDFETDSCFRNSNEQNVISINHCHRGRFECVFDKQNVLYLAEGDIALNSLYNLPKQSSVPMGRFYGSTILIFPEDMQDATLWEQFEIDFGKLSKKYGLERQCHIFRRDEGMEHIYDEIYRHIKKGKPNQAFLRVKVIELLYHFQNEEILTEKNETYLSKALTDKIKHVKEHFTEKPGERICLQELAKEHGLSLTQLKKYFKEIYGVTPHAYIRIYRMNVAAKLLSETDMKIGDIALEVAYKNPSKFSEAFMDIMGSSPSDYRMKYKK